MTEINEKTFDEPACNQDREYEKPKVACSCYYYDKYRRFTMSCTRLDNCYLRQINRSC